MSVCTYAYMYLCMYRYEYSYEIEVFVYVCTDNFIRFSGRISIILRIIIYMDEILKQTSQKSSTINRVVLFWVFLKMVSIIANLISVIYLF